MVPDGVDALQEDIAENVEAIVATGLNTTVPPAVRSNCEDKVLFLDGKLLVSNSNAEVWKLISGDRRGDQVALLLLIIFGLE